MRSSSNKMIRKSNKIILYFYAFSTPTLLYVRMYLVGKTGDKMIQFSIELNCSQCIKFEIGAKFERFLFGFIECFK